MNTKVQIKQVAAGAFFSVVEFIAMVIIYTVDFMNGRFGRYKLVPKVRRVWRVVTWTIFAILFFRFVLCPFFSTWDRVVNMLNYVIWG